MPRLISVKEAVSQASLEIGIVQTSVSNVVGSGDQDITQMLALLYAVADEVLLEEPYKSALGDGFWLVDAVTKASRDTVTADTDLIQFDGRLAINGLKFRFLKAKGLDYGEEMQDFTRRLNKLAGRLNSRVINLDEAEGRVE